MAGQEEMEEELIGFGKLSTGAEGDTGPDLKPTPEHDADPEPKPDPELKGPSKGNGPVSSKSGD